MNRNISVHKCHQTKRDVVSKTHTLSHKHTHRQTDRQTDRSIPRCCCCPAPLMLGKTKACVYVSTVARRRARKRGYVQEEEAASLLKSAMAAFGFLIYVCVCVCLCLLVICVGWRHLAYHCMYVCEMAYRRSDACRKQPTLFLCDQSEGKHAFLSTYTSTTRSMWL